MPELATFAGPTALIEARRRPVNASDSPVILTFRRRLQLVTGRGFIGRFPCVFARADEH